MEAKIILYGSPVCGMVPAVRASLERVGVAYEYVDISLDPEARRRVREINGGHETVPTLVFLDGSTLTEPSNSELQARLRALGYAAAAPKPVAPVQRILASPITSLLGLAALIVGLVLGTGWLVAIGALVLGLGLLSSWLWRRRVRT
jgi:mycoredoxin